MTPPLVTLRPFTAEDAPRLAAIGNDARIARNLRDGFPHPYALSDAEAFIRDIAIPNAGAIFAVEAAGELAGCGAAVSGVDVYRRSVELGVWVGVAHWRHGVATAAMRELMDRAFQRPGVVRVFAHIFGWNQAAARMVEKLGFVHEATLRNAVSKGGDLTDELIYALAREPSDPRTKG